MYYKLTYFCGYDFCVLQMEKDFVVAIFYEPLVYLKVAK